MKRLLDIVRCLIISFESLSLFLLLLGLWCFDISFLKIGEEFRQLILKFNINLIGGVFVLSGYLINSAYKNIRLIRNPSNHIKFMVDGEKFHMIKDRCNITLAILYISCLQHIIAVIWPNLFSDSELTFLIILGTVWHLITYITLNNATFEISERLSKIEN